METPRPLPTGNLYKFEALAGIALFIFCIAYFNQQIDQAKLAVTRATNDARILTAESEHLSLVLKDLQQWIVRAENRAQILQEKFTNATVTNNAQLRELSVQVTDKSDEETKLRHAIKLKQIELMNNRDLATLYTDAIPYKRKLFHVTAIGSLILMVIGFGSWYWKLQRFQDRIRKNEADLPSQQKPKEAD